MKYVVLVPGIMGSILSTPDKEEVWPPTIAEALGHYGRTDKLLRDDLEVGGIIRKVACFDVYRPLIETFGEMGFSENGPGDRLHLFPYDWRRDLEVLADRLAASLDGLPTVVQTITLAAHSMGGLITRLMLESGKYNARPWFAKIDAFLSLAVPHLGAPLALARVLGLDGAMGLAGADFRRLAADRRYPAGYQLLPAPGEGACWDIRPGRRISTFDIYDPAVATRLGLDPSLVARTAWVHSTLANGKAPDHVRYFYFAGTGHKTATRLNVGTAASQLTRTEDGGDGTVPLWSALPESAQKQLVVGEHSSFFTGNAFKAVFFALFDKPFPQPPVLLDGVESAALSVQALSLHKDEEIELVIAPAAPFSEIEAEMVLERTDTPNGAFTVLRAPQKITYAGPPVPVLKVRLPPAGRSGFYRVSLTGRPKAPAPVQFVATDV